MNPTISVVVLTYNQESTIARTLDSILAQKTDYPFEIIIGEDASPNDDTRRVCEEYAAKYPSVIRLLPKADNKGLLINYRDCLAECRGKYITLCAGDDYWCDPEKLQIQVDFLEANMDYVLVHAEMKRLDVSTGKITEPKFRKKIPNGFVHEELYRRNFIQAPTACFRARMIHHTDLKKWDDMNFLMEDLPMWLEFSRHGKFHYMPFYAVMYGVSPNSISNNRSFEKRLCFEDSIYRCLCYYRDKFNADISQEQLKKHYDAQVISIVISSRRGKEILKLFPRFGMINITRVLLKKIYWQFQKLSRT